MFRKRNVYIKPLANGTTGNDIAEKPRLSDFAEVPTDHVFNRENYVVQKATTQNNAKRKFSWLSPPLDSDFLRMINLINLLTWPVYLICEGRYLMALRETNSRIWWPIMLAMAAEYCLRIPEVFTSLEILIPWAFGAVEVDEVMHYTLSGDKAPLVDVMIACCGEYSQIIMDTVAAVTAQDYPSDRFRVFVLDDANSPELARLVEAYKATRLRNGLPSLSYVAREKKPGVRHYYKGGNLRNGFEMSEKLGQGSEYFAAVDADMIVHPKWLRRVLPQLLVDEEVALACPPQVCLLFGAVL